MKQRTAQGFTLIELLIVIAVLGILAVAVLSAINPIEQINRSRDTGSRSDAEQLIGAIDRYYATQGFYPWLTAPCTAANCEATAWGAVSTWNDGTTLLVLSKLSESGSGELKASFTNRISGATYNPLSKYHEGGAGDSTYVCFSPKSSSFKVEAATRCTTTGAIPDDYPAEACPSTCSVASPDTCYSCLP